jgi:hypothetical protein
VLIFHFRKGHLRLPLELVALVAETLHNSIFDQGLLYGDSLQTLASLNITCRSVHEITLPYLYKTTVYNSDQVFFKSVKSAVPEGWKWTE